MIATESRSDYARLPHWFSKQHRLHSDTVKGSSIHLTDSETESESSKERRSLLEVPD